MKSIAAAVVIVIGRWEDCARHGRHVLVIAGPDSIVAGGAGIAKT